MELDNVDFISPQEGSDNALNEGKLSRSKMVVLFLMVLSLVIASFFGGYYYSQKMMVTNCNQYILDNNLVKLVGGKYENGRNNNTGIGFGYFNTSLAEKDS